MKLNAQAAVKIASDKDGVFFVGVDVIGEHRHERCGCDGPERARHPAVVPENGRAAQGSEAKCERIFVRGGKQKRCDQADENRAKRAAGGDR